MLFASRLKMRAMTVLLLLSIVPFGSALGAEGEVNRIVSVSVQEDAREPVVEIGTQDPVGFRYTVYDSEDPKRIIVDFRDMSLSEVPEVIQVGSGPIDEIRTSTFDLTSGNLSRVEILLSQTAGYDVTLDGKTLKVALTGEDDSQESVQKPLAESAPADSQKRNEADSPENEAGNPTGEEKNPASRVEDLDIRDSLARISTNGVIEEYRHFTLTGPSRLVVDVYGVSPEFEERSFSADRGFKQVRVGAYDDKTRFVFDSSEVQLPDFVIDTKNSDLLVDWSKTEQAPADLERQDVAAEKQQESPDAPVAVNDVSFSVEDGKSVLSVELSSERGRIVEPVQEDGLVRFGVENATISRNLRRNIDASAFPSAVRIVTPYTVQIKDGQHVMFAVDLKGPVDHELKRTDGELRFVVDNGPFAEEPFDKEERREVALPAREEEPAPAARDTVSEAPAEDAEPAEETPAARPTDEEELAAELEEPEVGFAAKDMTPGEGEYTGQEISLVFDNADIQNILQLIADVSDLNIIATEEVQGNLSIRLIDVPWDQALDIILDIKELGMVKKGNVVRILPKSKIREMERSELEAAQTRQELEPVVTEVITVNYTDLGSITGPAQNILSERGKITEDARNKQLIVTDVPSRVTEVKRLVAILDTPEKQVVIEARIVEASSSFSRDLGVSWGLSYDAEGSNGSGDPDQANLGLGGSFVITPPTQGTVGSSGLSTGITFGRVGIDSTTLDLRISALESSGYGKVISTPRVTTLNGQQASISQGTMIPYQSVGDAGTETEFIDAELSLDVTPVINPDGSVILQIDAANSSVGSIVPTGSGSAPSVDTKEATTQVLVQNGETTVIGGIFVEDEDFAETGVPLLRSIPILGHLFKSTTKSTIRNELLIFITPRIVE
ncbi:MAG: type IV pilus secretin PilQ [Desulfuromonadales bacterium]